MKSFEIFVELGKKNTVVEMNYKLEKFWNPYPALTSDSIGIMNYKLEKFWNQAKAILYKYVRKTWTINLKRINIIY